MTTRTQIADWLIEGLIEACTHMIIVCDTWDHSDYPVYVEEGEDVREIETKFKTASMQRVVEIYHLGTSLDWQLSLLRVHNYEANPEHPLEAKYVEMAQAERARRSEESPSPVEAE